MCGIAGKYNFNGEPVEQELLGAMQAQIKHRGPDDGGMAAHENVGLCHARLSILDLSLAGKQPMSDREDKLQVVFNGEIYNFQDIRRELERLGHRFVSKSDTEVILYAYKQWGPDCLERFNGMFAFAIFDKQKKELFLARDRLGEKPLYYFSDDETFVFASEIKAILADGTIPRLMSNQGLANYFAFGHSVGPETMYSGIKKLLPGHYMIVSEHAVSVTQYWDVSKNTGEDKGFGYYLSETKNKLEASVVSRLVSDVPLGVFLSGGIDSSLVASFMEKHTTEPLKTFSVGFGDGGKEFNELTDAAKVAKHLRTDHHELVLKESDLQDALSKIVYHFDEPFGDAASFPLYLMSQFAKKHVSVVLTGEGADELFGGYRRYIAENSPAWFPLLKAVSPLANKGLALVPGLRRLKKTASAFSKKTDLERYASWISFFSPEALSELLNEGYGADPLFMYKEYVSLYKERNWLDTAMKLDQKVLLPDGYLEKVDKMTMAFGLEARAPFLDHHVVEFANAMPKKYKVSGRKTKVILRELARQLLPREIAEKPKHGFSVPTSLWLKGKLKDYAFEVLFDERTKQRGYINNAYIEKIYKQYAEKGQPLSDQLWLLLNFELWHRQFIHD